MMGKIPLEKKLSEHLRKNFNGSFHLESLPWNTQVVISELCKLIEKELDLIKTKSDMEKSNE